MPSVEDLIGEISQIMGQYRREVPGQRSQIPSSVKERVLALEDLGLNCAEISRKTGLPYFSVLNWRKRRKRSGFKSLPISDDFSESEGLISETDTVTVPSSRRKRRNLVTVTVPTLPSTVCIVTPSGIRIEGVSPELLRELVPELGSLR